MKDKDYTAAIEAGAKANEGMEDLYGFGQVGTRENPATYGTSPTMQEIRAKHDQLMRERLGDCYHEAQGRRFITERKITTRGRVVHTSYLHIYVINAKGDFEKGYCVAHYKEDKNGNFAAI